MSAAAYLLVIAQAAPRAVKQSKIKPANALLKKVNPWKGGGMPANLKRAEIGIYGCGRERFQL